MKKRNLTLQHDHFKESYSGLKVFKNGTGLAVVIPQHYIKKSGLKPGDLLDVDFSIDKLQIGNDLYLKFAKFYHELCKVEPKLEKIDLDVIIRIVITWLLEFNKPEDKRRKVTMILEEAIEKAKHHEEREPIKADLEALKLINSHLKEFYSLFEKVFINELKVKD